MEISPIHLKVFLLIGMPLITVSCAYAIDAVFPIGKDGKRHYYRVLN